MRVNNDQFLPPTNGASGFNSNAYPLNQIFGFAIQAVITGTLNGSLSLQISCDPNTSAGSDDIPTNWTTYAGSPQTVTGVGTAAWSVSDPWFTWVRLVWTFSSGSGTISEIINSKGQ